jgi:uncharacterized protein (TIGR03067 family)
MPDRLGSEGRRRGDVEEASLIPLPVSPCSAAKRKRCNRIETVIFPMRQLSYVLVFGIPAVICCPAFAGDADDARRLQGTWEIVELIQYGKKVDFNIIKGTKFKFTEKNVLTIQPPSDKVEEFEKRSFSYKLNPLKKPAEVELSALDGKHKGVTSPGIYELKGDTLRWCQSDATKAPERPKDFTSPEKSPFYLFTLKREK